MRKMTLPLLLLPVGVLAGQQPTLDQLQSMLPLVANNTTPAWSADGASLYYIGHSALWRVAAGGGLPVTVSAPLGNATQFKRSPDGRLLTYVKDVPGGSDVFAWDVAVGSERRISTLSGRVRSYMLSPDGRRLVMANDRNGSEDIWVVNLTDGAARRITSSPLYETFPSWSADGAKVLYTQLDKRWVDHDVYEIPVAGGTPRLVVSDKNFFDYRQGASFGFAAVSPDGETLLFRSQRSGWASYWVVPCEGGTPRQLAAEPADQSDARWSPDGKEVLFLSITNGTQQLKVASAAGGAARALVAPSLGLVSRAEWSPDGKSIAFMMGTPTTVPDLYVVSAAGGTPRRLTSSPAAPGVVTPEKISWPSEGLTINAYLYTPRLATAAKAPVIMLVHGGPTSQFSDAFQLQAQFFASQGYVVIAPNVRGSSGYGKRFEDLNNGDWGHGDLRDVLAGVEWAKRQPWVNRDKIGITGVSYGGMLTMYAISFAPGVFQAAISGSGYGDVRDFHTIVPELQHSQLLHYELGEWPSTPAVDSIYRRSSAILKTAQATAPAMVIHGYGLHQLDTDYAAWKYARELAKHSKVVEYKAYPNETYYVYGRENTKQMLQDMLAFFDRYLKDNSVDGPG
jgi:dipeptidyl aminopeptidase/acylaminoacyl peptidase